MPTRRGVTLFVAGIALFVGGRFLALGELAIVGMVLVAIVMVMAAVVWLQVLRVRLVHLRIERLHPDSNVFANEPFPVTLRAVANHSRVPYCTLTEVVSGTDALGSATGTEEVRRSLTAGLCRTGELTYERTLPRGLHQLGPGRMTVLDSLGLARVPIREVPSTTAYVWPETRHLETQLVGQLFELSAIDADSEPGDLREYVVGDDLRHVHWPTSARTDRLMVRDRQSSRRADRTNLVIADISATTNSRDFELVLSVAGSLLYSVDPLDQVELLLVGPSGVTSHTGIGRAMAALCRALPDRQTKSDPLAMLDMLDTGIVVATDETVVPVNARGPVIRCSGRAVGDQQEGTYTVFRVPSLDRLEFEIEQGLHSMSGAQRT